MFLVFSPCISKFTQKLHNQMEQEILSTIIQFLKVRKSRNKNKEEEKKTLKQKVRTLAT